MSGLNVGSIITSIEFQGREGLVTGSIQENRSSHCLGNRSFESNGVMTSPSDVASVFIQILKEIYMYPSNQIFERLGGPDKIVTVSGVKLPDGNVIILTICNVII